MTLNVNADRVDLDLDPGRTLADALSTDCAVTGGHHGCADGTCGGCTVLVDGAAIRACLILGVQCGGVRVRTVEGLSEDHPLRAVLEANEDADCVAGLVMLAAGAIENDPGLAADPGQLRRLLNSNVCRRAGHTAVQDLVVQAVAQARGVRPAFQGRRRPW